MSKHEDIREQLSAYLDEELSAEDTQRVESALAEDADLAAELEQLRKTRRLVQSLPRQGAGDDFAEKVMQAAFQQGALSGGQTWKPSAMPNPWRRYFAAAALILFAVGLGVFFSITLYLGDATPQPSSQSELAINASDETEDVETVGTIARDLGEMPGVTARKIVAPQEEPVEAAKSYEPGATRREVVMKKTMTPPEEPAMAMKPSAAPAPDMAPGGYTVTRGAPVRGERPAVSSKSGGLAKEENEFATKDDAYGFEAKNAPVYRKGPTAPYDQPADVMAGPQPVTTLVKNVAPADNEVIYTDDLATGQKMVEAVLISNAVEVTPPNQRTLQPSQATNLPPMRPEGLRMKSAGRVQPRQLQYVVYGTVHQLQQVREQLEKDVRAKQTVDQLYRRNVANQPRFAFQSDTRESQTESKLTEAPQKNGWDSETPPDGQTKPIAKKASDVEAKPQLADAKEKKSARQLQAETELTATQPATTQQSISLAVAQQPTSQQTELRFSTDQQQAPQSQRAQMRQGLLRNQAMIVTLELRPTAKK